MTPRQRAAWLILDRIFDTAGGHRPDNDWAEIIVCLYAIGAGVEDPAPRRAAS